MLVLSTSHTPGALFWCLGAFASRGINLLKLESRPIRQRPWEYFFYLDVEGHAQDEACSEALQELRAKTVFIKILGSFAAEDSIGPAGVSSR